MFGSSFQVRQPQMNEYSVIASGYVKQLPCCLPALPIHSIPVANLTAI
jgi:hypothetical protein